MRRTSRRKSGATRVRPSVLLDSIFYLICCVLQLSCMHEPHPVFKPATSRSAPPPSAPPLSCSPLQTAPSTANQPSPSLISTTSPLTAPARRPRPQPPARPQVRSCAFPRPSTPPFSPTSWSTYTRARASVRRSSSCSTRARAGRRATPRRTASTNSGKTSSSCGDPASTPMSASH